MRTLIYRRIVRPFLWLLLLPSFAVMAGSAQTRPIVQSFVTQPISEQSLITLRGNTLPIVQPQYDRGPVADVTPVQRLLLILKRSPQQEADLQSFLQSVQQPTSPDYRKFLSPEEFGKRYGLSNADLAKVQQWLKSHGFTVANVNKGRTAIEFSGTVSQLQQTFHTSIHRFLVGGAGHWANMSDPQIPAALAPVVAGVANLNDFKPHSHLILGPAGKWNPQLHRFTPELTITSNGSKYLFVGPGDAATIYDSPNTFNTKLASGQAKYDGTGVTIGIVGDTFLNDSGSFFYHSLFGVSTLNGPTTVYDGDQSNMVQDADETEAILDTEVSSGLAPGANVVYYAAGDTVFQPGLFLAIYRAIDDNKADILSVSYGECEASLGAAGNLQILNAWEQAAAQGITVTVSSGDSGSAGCDDQDTETVATQGLAVNGFASTPYNIAVGGTDFDILSQSFLTYVSATDSPNYTSALSYIPENPWNDSTAVNGLLAADTVYTNGSGEPNIVAGGGGASSLGTGSAGYAKPLWQEDFALSGIDTVRDLPDVSLLAGNGQYEALWALCIGADSDCSSGDNSTIHGVGGTSAAAPAFAGILAMINQKMGTSTRLGQANWVLYKLAQTTPTAFHQITTGNDSVHCSASSPDCGANGFLTGYNAGASYNLATGLGSVDISALVNAWASDSLTATSTTLSLNKTTFTHGTSVNFTSDVNPAAATGNVAIITNYASQAQATTSVSPFRLALSGGSASGSYSELPGGTYDVYANYSGDGNYAGSIAQPVQVMVSPENSTLNFSVDAVSSNSQASSIAGQTVPLGTLITLNAQPIGASQASSPTPIVNATGAVVFTDSNSGGLSTGFGNVPLDSTGNAEANTYSLNAGAHSISASYSGDLSYNPSSAGPINFTVSKAPTAITVTSTASSIISGSLTVEAQIATSLPSNALTTTGSVIFTDNTSNTVLGSVPAGSASQCTPATSLCFSAALSVPVTQFVAGANNVVATYSGDSNFAGSGPSAAVVITCVAGCYTATGQTLSLSFGQESNADIAPGGTVTAIVSVGPGGGFTGAVNLTCTIAGKTSGDQNIPTCSFSPAQVDVTNSDQAVTSTITINTTAATTTAFLYPARDNTGRRRWLAAGGAALASVLLLGFAPRRFKRRYLMGLLGLVLAVSWMSACGGGGSSGAGGGGGGGGGGTTIPGTTADTYTVTFHAADATSGTVTAQDYFNFIVN